MTLFRSLALVLIFVCGAFPRIDVSGLSNNFHSQKAPLAVNAHGSAHQFRVSRRINSLQLWLLSKGYWSRELRPVRSLPPNELELATPSNQLALLCRLRL